MRTKLGRPPVLLDSNLTTIAKKQMGLYLANKGYFNANIKDSVILHKRKATVVYVIRPNIPYTIRSIHYAIADTQLAKFVFLDTARALIHAGHNYDTYLLDGERSRITKCSHESRILSFFQFIYPLPGRQHIQQQKHGCHH